MGRRKKEPISVHREHIADAAQRLFMEKGIEATSMDDIAKVSGYSKATLYVYFRNKDDIVGRLVLESMRKLDVYLSESLTRYESTKEKYDLICQSLVQYQEEYPFYFKLALDKINIDFEKQDYLPEEEETYHIGEEINNKIRRLFCDGIEKGELREDVEIMPTIFAFWGMLSGFIQIVNKKEDYITQNMGLTKRSYFEYGFDLLYHSISK